MKNRVYELEPNPREVTAKEDDDIYVSIVVGNAQIGSSKVTYKNNDLVKGDLKNPAFLGKAGELDEENIRLLTNVMDVNQSTNRCVITTKFFDQDEKILFSKIDNGSAPENGIASFIGFYSIRVLSALFLCFFYSRGPLLRKKKKMK